MEIEKQKIYLAGGISDTDRKKGQIRTALELQAMGFEVYAAAMNDSIDDKSNNPTPEDIYNADVKQIIDSDLFVVRISGGNEDGTLSEIGVVAGYNEGIESAYDNLDCQLEGLVLKPIPIVAYTTNERINIPQFSDGIASAGFNHLVLGMIQRYGKFVGNEDQFFRWVRRYKKYQKI